MNKLLTLSSVILAISLSGCTTFKPGYGNSEHGPSKPDDSHTESDDSHIKPDSESEVSEDDSTEIISYDDSQVTAPSYEEISTEEKGDFTITTEDGSFSNDGNVYTITSAGTYNVVGTLEEGNIFIEAGEDDSIVINLNGVSITSAVNSPIFIKEADSVKLYSDSGYENIFIDNRSNKTVDDDTQGNGAIYSKCDLSFTGKGTVKVKANYNNGIHSTKDLSFKNNTVSVESYNNCLKGNDNVEIKSGSFLLISHCGNGIITEDSDVSSKGNQRGNITISSGAIDIYCCKDGIDAAYDAIIQASGDNSPKINIYTSEFSGYGKDPTTGEEEEGNTYYLRTSTQISSSYRLALYCCDKSKNYSWIDAPYYKSVSSQGGPGQQSRTYYYYKFNMPENASSFVVYEFNSSSENSTESYVAKSSTISVNSYHDTCAIRISGSSITQSSWTDFSTGGGGMGPQDDGNDDKAEYSAKGIKASNKVNISAGTIYIKSYDDGIHANYGDTLENGETGVGDVDISGGNITIYASDDGLHADRYLNISGGTTVISNSYEGLEANVLNITGGDTLVYASDDGANAAEKAGLSPAINIKGGKLDITIASGDTDGIDSNGDFTQTGGVVISRGSPGSGNHMSTSLDVDGTASISGGTFISFGPMEKTLGTGINITKKTFSGTFGIGTYTINCGETSIVTTNKASYSGMYVYTDLTNNATYTKA